MYVTHNSNPKHNSLLKKTRRRKKLSALIVCIHLVKRMFRINQLKCNNGQHKIIQSIFVKQSTVAAVQTTESTGNDNQRIVIPKKINRSPTDLLYTLSKTVGRDPTATHYKFQDDPYLIPLSNRMREQFALSQESGKKTALWFMEKHSELFNAKDAQPKIEAFLPKAIYTEESDLDVKQLKKAIDTLNVSGASTIYDLLTKKKVNVPDNLKQSLLELLCFYNHKDPIPFDMFEERAAVEVQKRSSESNVELWQENGLADQLYESIEPKTPAAYNAMIRGLYKHSAYKRGDDLYKMAGEKQIPLDLETYNLYIGGINRPGKSTDMRFDEIKMALNEINKQQLKPNVHTLNACLRTLKIGGNIFSIQNYTNQILAEFLALNIEPSLETYVHMLDIYHGKNASHGTVLYDIVDRIERNPELVAQSRVDLMFFTKAMLVCTYRLKDAGQLARRIDNIVTNSNNIKFLGDSQQEQYYYRYFLHTILKNETFTEFLRVYNELVPETYGLEPSITDEILGALNINGQIQHVPLFWHHMVLSNVSKNNKINDTLLLLMETNRPVDGVAEHNGLVEQFGNIAWEIYRNSTASELIADRSTRNGVTELVPAQRLSSIIILLLRAGNHNNASTIVERCLDKGKDKHIFGFLSDVALGAYLDSCIERKEPGTAIRCLCYAVEHGIGDQISFGRKMIQSFTLEPKQIRQITDLVGNDALKPVETPNKKPDNENSV